MHDNVDSILELVYNDDSSFYDLHLLSYTSNESTVTSHDKEREIIISKQKTAP